MYNIKIYYKNGNVEVFRSVTDIEIYEDEMILYQLSEWQKQKIFKNFVEKIEIEVK